MTSRIDTLVQQLDAEAVASYDARLDWELDGTAPWERLVEEARAWSLIEATEAPVGENIFVAPHLDRPH